MDANLTSGCLSCFCYGHSSQCSSSFNYVENILKLDTKLWSATSLDGSIEKTVSLENEAMFIYNIDEDIWFNAPQKFLGNQRHSYAQPLSFALRFKLVHSSAIRKDLIIEGAGFQVYRQLYDLLDQNEINSGNMQSDITKEFRFVLKETDGWRPSLTKNDFQRLLSNLTAIKIKTTYGGWNFLSNFQMRSAKKMSKLALDKDTSLSHVSWIEDCVCPDQYTGQFCETCQVGFTRQVAAADSFTKCVPCSCNNHSLSCNPTTGK